MRAALRAHILRVVSTFLIAVLLVAATACSGKDPSGAAAGQADPAPKPGGRLVIGSISDVDAWNEYMSRSAFSSDILRRIFLRLAYPLGDSRDHPPTYEPSLAESWEFSPNGKELTFELRKAVWSDGRPVSAKDVVFTWKAQTSPDVAWPGAANKTHVVSVVPRGERAVVFRFDRAYPDAFTDAVDGGILPAHVFGAIPFEQWRTHDWSTVRVGSGPFLLDTHRPADEIVLVRNPQYVRAGFPLLDAVTVRIVPDASSLVTQLLGGGVDYMDGVPPRDAARVRAAAGRTLVAYDEPKYDYIGWNGAKVPFDDPRVRRALTLAIDREALVADLLYGFGRVSRGPILSFWWGADASLEPWPHDPDAATRLLAEAGFSPGKDGVLRRDGAPLAFELSTNAGNRLREAMLVKIQEQLARIGVRATPTPLEMKTFMQQNTAGKYDAYLSSWRFAGKIDLRSIFHSSSIPTAGNNVVFYRSAETDRLLDLLDAAPDWKGMVPVLCDIQNGIHQDLPYTFLYETQRLAAAGPRLQGLKIDVPSDPLLRLETYWVTP